MGPLGNLTTANRTITVNNGAVLQLGSGDVFPQANFTAALNISGEVISTVGSNGNTLGPVTLTGGTLAGLGGWNGLFQMFNLGNNAATGIITANGSNNSYITGTGTNTGFDLCRARPSASRVAGHWLFPSRSTTCTAEPWRP